MPPHAVPRTAPAIQRSLHGGSALDHRLGPVESIVLPPERKTFRAFRITPDGTRLVAAHVEDADNELRGSLSVVDLTDPQAEPDGVGFDPGFVFDLEVSSDGATAYVVFSRAAGGAGSEGPNRVDYFDLTKSPPERTQRVQFGDLDGTIQAALTADGATLYVTARGTDEVHIIDTAGAQVLASVGTVNSASRSPVGIALTPDDSKVLAVNRGNTVSPSVAIIDTATRLRDAIVPLSLVAGNASTFIAVGQRPPGLPANPQIFRAYVTNSTTLLEACISVLEIDVENGIYQEIGVVEGIGDLPQGVQVSPDGSKVYVGTAFPPGELQMINAETLELEQRVSVRGSIANVVLDPTRITDFDLNPRIWVRAGGTKVFAIEPVQGAFLSPDGDPIKTEALADHEHPDGSACPDPSSPGAPDPGVDQPVEFLNLGDRLLFFRPSGADANEVVREILLLNPHPVTGTPQDYLIRGPGQVAQAASGVIGMIQNLFVAFQQVLNPGDIRIATETFGSDFRPVSAAFEVGTALGTMDGTISGLDEDDDGIYEASRAAGLPVIGDLDSDVELHDVNGDGTGLYRLIPSFLTSDHPSFVPLGDTNGDGEPDSVAWDFDGDGTPDPGLPLMPLVAGPANPEVELKIHFPQFANGALGETNIFSQILLFSLDPDNPAQVKILIRNDDGQPLAVTLNGELVNGEKDDVIPAGGLLVLESDGQGPVVAGSVTVCSDRAVGGVVVFSGTVGTMGVGNGLVVTAGFAAPIEVDDVDQTNTGIAVQNLEAVANELTLQLCDLNGTVLARAALREDDALAANGHWSRFVTEIEWVPEEGVELDFSNFQGILKVGTSADAAATVLQTRPGELATLPVARDLQSVQAGNVLAFPGLPQVAAKDYKIHFAQFADGAGLFSQILLLNTSDQTANIQVLLRDSPGNPLTVNVNGQEVSGELNFALAAGGMRILQTDGVGELKVGSVTVCSDRALSGTILFAGVAGVAGVGSSAVVPKGFVATLQSSAAELINSGIAIMNTTDETVTLALQLCDSAGNLLAEGELPDNNELPSNGHIARFLDQIVWAPEEGVQLDFSDFKGLLKVRASGRVAATVLQTRPGVFATQPVVPSLN